MKLSLILLLITWYTVGLHAIHFDKYQIKEKGILETRSKNDISIGIHVFLATHISVNSPYVT